MAHSQELLERHPSDASYEMFDALEPDRGKHFFDERKWNASHARKLLWPTYLPRMHTNGSYQGFDFQQSRLFGQHKPLSLLWFRTRQPLGEGCGQRLQTGGIIKAAAAHKLNSWRSHSVQPFRRNGSCAVREENVMPLEECEQLIENEAPRGIVQANHQHVMPA
jgi:hypothetical protein